MRNDFASGSKAPGRGHELLGRPRPNPVSSQRPSGDFQAGYLIADRLGMSVELVPHLFGATNRFPTGQRGLFAIWRTGGGVTAANALRYMEVK
jgi:hypothetical protein